ncbi:unnamed protein product [Leptidea sinapis]|uniref:Uncharacterized protein n=1 Tax=Leptidea sinapis TaxID=189913 RepID=A0A5E4Q4R6_9NEOP|nr:unnamed protein product [Leptidea sinapis]
MNCSQVFFFVFVCVLAFSSAVPRWSLFKEVEKWGHKIRDSVLNAGPPVVSAGKISKVYKEGGKSGKKGSSYISETPVVEGDINKNKTEFTYDNSPQCSPRGTTLNESLLNNISSLIDTKLAPDSKFMPNLKSLLREEVKTMIKSEINLVLPILKEELLDTLKNEFTESTDFLNHPQCDLKKIISDKNEIIKNLEFEQSRLKSECNEIQNRLITLEKISRDNNLEVQNVPEKKNENVQAIFLTLYRTFSINPFGSVADLQICRP